MTLFWKQVDGCVATLSRPETWDGTTYQVSRPYNSDPARIRGLELQANNTVVDSATPDRRLGAEVPLQNLSRHSADLIGLYEHGPASARRPSTRGPTAGWMPPSPGRSTSG